MPSYPAKRTPNSSPSVDPHIYSTLETAEHNAWDLLKKGARDRHAPFHTPTVATVSANGYPQARTVVLRAADPQNRSLRFHTDKRSQKIADLKHTPHISMHFYDVTEKLQLRIQGLATCRHQDTMCATIWSNMRVMSRKCYFQAVKPGEPVEDITAVPQFPNDTPDLAYENFCVIMVEVVTLDMLYLAAKGHKRALFDYTDKSLKMQWIAP